MSYVGGPYVYDVFFSYAYAKDKTKSDGLGEWSRAVARLITARLSLMLNGGQSPEREVRVFLDNIEAGPGTDLTYELLHQGVEKSATFIVILSEFYWQRPWCRDELNAWAETRPGKPEEFNCFPILAQTTTPPNWPPMLIDERGNPFTALPFTDKDGQPEGFGLPEDRIMAELYQQINDISAFIVARLKELRSLQDAKDRMNVSGLAAEDKIIFLEAESEDESARESVYETLKAKVKVVPAANLGYMASAMQGGPGSLSPKEFYSECNGLVLLRSRPNDHIELRIIKAAKDRSEMSSSSRPFLCAVFNELPGTPVPSADMFGVPVIEKSERWVDTLLEGLR